ncbi:MAG: hypothetical protein MJY52_05420, partial [Bacteroidaceae bacterium]|nr:hypothetical protein [Bacteroidaceae bacterium]
MTYQEDLSDLSCRITIVVGQTYHLGKLESNSVSRRCDLPLCRMYASHSLVVLVTKIGCACQKEVT